MWISKTLDILGALIYIALIFWGFFLGFRKSLRVTFVLLVVTVMNAVVYRIFKYFLIKEYLILLELGIISFTSVISFFIFQPLIPKIYDIFGDIEPRIIDRILGLIQFLVDGVLIIGYFVIFSAFIPQFYYILDSSALLRIFENIVKIAIGIKIF